MYYGRKKIIIIATVVIISVIILVGVGLFLFLKTDLFKSNENLFYKYMGEQLSAFKMESNTQLEELEMYKQQMPYLVKGELSIKYENMDESQRDLQEKISELFGNLKIVVDGKYDKQNEKENTAYTLEYGTQKLFEIEQGRTNDIYGLKSNEIVQNAYVGLRNDNLKVFAQKLGIESSMTQTLPDKLETTNVTVNDILEISPQELKHIQDTYTPVFLNMIKSDNYSKQSNVSITVNSETYDCNSYRLDLTGEEVKNIAVTMLTELQQDSITLNLITTKAKMLGLSEDYTEINKLTTQIQNLKNNIGTILKRFEAGVSIAVYESEGNPICVEFIIKNQEKYTFSSKMSGNTKIFNIQVDNLSTNKSYTKANINMIETKTSTQTSYQLEVDIDNETTITFLFTSNGLASTNEVENRTSVSVTSQDVSITGEYIENIEFKEEIENISELDNTNTAILNDYTKEQLDMFIPAVVERVVTVFNEKLAYIGLVLNNIQQPQLYDVNQ